MKLLGFLTSPFADTNSNQPTHSYNYNSLDGIRGIAVLVVVLGHTQAFGMLYQASIGVILFYFLSGFVLSLAFVQSQKKMLSLNGLKQYFKNRALRLIPAYWVACILIFLYADVEIDWLLWNMSFIKGWGHFWSVAQEFRFYILLPIVVAILAFLRIKPLQILALLTLAYLFYDYRLTHKVDMMTNGKSVGFYFWVFLGGASCCFITHYAPTKRFLKLTATRYVLTTCASISLLMLFIGSNYMIQHTWQPIFTNIPDGTRLDAWKVPHIWFFLFASIFISVTTYKESILNRILSFWPLRHIGLLSYSIYLYHMNIMFVLHKGGHGLRDQKLFFAVLGVSYVFAYLSYILIEKPALSLKKSTK